MADLTNDARMTLTRWRLVLGKTAEQHGICIGDARPEFNKTSAAKCRKMEMDILSCTPEKLAESMAHIIRG
jgi:hypothetical protein